MLSHYNFVQDGFRSCGAVFDPALCKTLLEQVATTRDFRNIFLSEAEYRSNPQHKGVNPRPGRNLLAKLDSDFIFSNETFTSEMRKVLGDRWRILDYKFVMGVPHDSLPDWIQKETEGKLVANLGAYVQECYRDITYFHGIDFHQDIIDFPDREADFITAYIYLDETTPKSSPLYVLPRSHELGASVFPHHLEKAGSDNFRYQNDFGTSGEYPCHMLTGPAGSLYYWHSALLHGTQPHQTDTPRISVRLLIEKNAKSDLGCELDQANQRLKGPLSLTTTRTDLDDAGVAVVRGNKINKMV